MTIFPQLTPNEISFDMGRSNISEVATFAGPIRFRHSQRVNGHELQLTYRGLSQSDVEELRTHYINNQGTHGYFTVPVTTWGGLSVVNSNSLYRYISSPTEEHTGLHYNVNVALRTIDGILLIYLLDGGGASQPAVAAFSSFAFNGNAPFILDCNGVSVAPTLLLESSGASL